MPPKQRPTISVVVPVLNARRHLRACLDSVTRAMKYYGCADLTIVDNGSTDGSYEILLDAYGSEAGVLQIKGVTIGSLRNSGARVGRGRYISFIDSDCVIPEDYFARIAEVFSSEAVDATGCMYDLPPDPNWVEETWQGLHERGSDGYVSFINSGNFAIRRAVFEKTGGFSETLITGEDAEYGLRLRAAAYRVYQSHSVSAIHLGNPRTLAAFFRKHCWHGLGMFGSLRLSWLDKPLWATFAFLALSAFGIGMCFLRALGPGVRVAVLLTSTLLVPVATVAYRGVRTGRLYRPFRSTFLYWIYFAARGWALLVLFTRFIGLGKTGGHKESECPDILHER